MPGMNEKKIRALQWYMVESKDFNLNVSFKLKNENGNLVSFTRQSVTFRLSSKGV